MRTDTQRLDWILAALDSGNEEPLERLQAAYTLELRGRPAMDAAMGAKLIEPGEPMPALTAIDLATTELGRIRNVKGFSEEMDDTQINEQLARAAVCYVAPYATGGINGSYWPWNPESFKPSPDDRKKELTKGIALALCELDRLIRAERRANEAGLQEYLESPEHKAYIDSLCEPEDAQPRPREFKVGDRVKCAETGYLGLPAPTSGTIVRCGVDGFEVRVDGHLGTALFYRENEMEHVDG